MPYHFIKIILERKKQLRRINMEKKRLGNSDMEITRLGLGAWAIGGSWAWGWGRQEDRDSIETIHKALESGINWIDTAPVYGLGHSEEVVAKALNGTGYTPYIFTKCSLVWNDKDKVSGVLKKESIRKEVEDSLRRLNVDVLDLCQVHWPNPDGDIEEAWETLAELQWQQKIRYIGVSNFSVEQIKRAQKMAPVTSLQPPYSLVFPEVEEEILPYCLEEGIGVINYSPMASGLLSGKMSKERLESLPADDWRHKSPDFSKKRLGRNLALAELLGKIGSPYNRTAGEVAIAWTLLNPAVTAAIVGMRNPEQVAGVINAADIFLSEEDIGAIQKFLSVNP
jgi:aryl-alcohol dehydrogenase-like predicted oxidoreductase